MRVYLIDAENINLEMFIKSREFEIDDKFYLVGYSSLKFGIDVLKFLQDREYFVYKFDNPSDNYADKIIFTILGYIMNDSKFSEFFIVSNDGIFVNLAYTEKFFGKRVENIKFSNSTSLVKATHKKEIVEVKKDEIKPNLQNPLSIKEIYEKNIEDIEILRHSYPKNDEFHNSLVKLFGMEIGKELYKISKSKNTDEIKINNTTKPKDKNELFYEKNRAKIDEILKENESLLDIHNNLLMEFGEDGKGLYKFLKESKKI